MNNTLSERCKEWESRIVGKRYQMHSKGTNTIKKTLFFMLSSMQCIIYTVYTIVYVFVFGACIRLWNDIHYVLHIVYRTENRIHCSKCFQLPFFFASLFYFQSKFKSNKKFSNRFAFQVLHRNLLKVCKWQKA